MPTIQSQFAAVPTNEAESESPLRGRNSALEIDADDSSHGDHRAPLRAVTLRSRIIGAIKFFRKNTTVVLVGMGVLASLLYTIFYELAFGASCRGILGAEYKPPLQILDKYNTDRGTSDKPFRVLLFGDSLIYRTKVSLAETIPKYIPQYNLKIDTYSFDATGISGLEDKLDSVIVDATDVMGGVDAVILYWDTDIADADWYHMDTAKKINHRRKYVAALTRVVKAVKEETPLLAIAGPQIAGEGPLFAPPVFNGVFYDYHRTYSMLEEYRIINRAMCATHQLPYIDVRRAFLDATPWYRWGFRGCLTDDGENGSEEGGHIVAKLFAETIFGWLNTNEVRAQNVTSKYVSQLYRPVEYYLW
jgi:hypothetical protein